MSGFISRSLCPNSTYTVTSKPFQRVALSKKVTFVSQQLVEQINGRLAPETRRRRSQKKSRAENRRTRDVTHRKICITYRPLGRDGENNNKYSKKKKNGIMTNRTYNCYQKCELILNIFPRTCLLKKNKRMENLIGFVVPIPIPKPNV